MKFILIKLPLLQSPISSVSNVLEGLLSKYTNCVTAGFFYDSHDVHQFQGCVSDRSRAVSYYKIGCYLCTLVLDLVCIS